MKYYLLLLLAVCFTNNEVHTQGIPSDIQIVIERLRAEEKIKLDIFKMPYGKSNFLRTDIVRWFGGDSLYYRAEALGIDLSNVYDDSMRNRVVQLLRNEYREDELDTLVNRNLEWESDNIKRRALNICRYDTLQIYKDSLASFFERERERAKYRNLSEIWSPKLLQMGCNEYFRL